jgi:hypothetical protein
MSIELVRVIHEQHKKPSFANSGSILLDKIDQSQGNSDSPPYAQIRKQAVYVPYTDADIGGKGFIDLVQTDNVKLQNELANGVIAKLEEAGHISTIVFDSALIAAPVLTLVANSAGTTTLTGTTFVSIDPVETQVIITNAGTPVGTFGEADFASLNATTITITDATVGGTPTTNWTFQVFANKQLTAVFVMP